MKINKTMEKEIEEIWTKPSTDSEVREHWDGIISNELIEEMIEYWRDELARSKKEYQEELLAEIEKMKHGKHELCACTPNFKKKMKEQNILLDKVLALIKTGGQK